VGEKSFTSHTEEEKFLTETRKKISAARRYSFKKTTEGAVGSFMRSLTRKIRLNDIKHTGTKF